MAKKRQLNNEIWIHRDSMYYQVYGLHTGPALSDDNNIDSSVNIGSVVKAFSNAHEAYLNNYISSNKEDIRDRDLEKKYNDFLAKDSNRTDLQKVLQQKGYDVNLDNVFKGLGENIDNLNTARKILIDTLDNKLSILSENKYIKVETLERMQKEVDKILTNIEKEITKAKTKAQLKEAYQLERDRYYKIVKTLKKHIEYYLGKSEGKMIDISDSRGTISHLNDLIRTLNRASILQSSGGYIQGQIGEIIGAAIGYSIAASKESITDNILEAIDDSSAGTGYVYIKRDQESGQVESEIRASKKDFEADLSFDYTESHVSKVDIIIQDKNNSNKEIKQSIKNYSSFSSLTLVSGTPLSEILSVNKSKDFMYHYGNMLPRMYKEKHKATINLDSYRKQMNSIIQKSALKIALLGYSDKIDIPDVFVVFNSQKQEVRIFNTKPLLAYLIDQSKSANFALETYGVKGVIDYDKTLDDLGISNINEQNNKRNQVENLFYNHKVHMSISVGNIK